MNQPPNLNNLAALSFEEAVKARLARIEAKLDALIAALGEEEGPEDEVLATLDGLRQGASRDPRSPL